MIQQLKSARALGVLVLFGAGCQLAIDSDRFSFSFEGSGEIITGSLDPHSDDAGASSTSDAGDASAGNDGETGVISPSPVCDGCRITGICVPAGVRRPSNPCEVCDPSRDSTTWSNRDGACDDGLHCTVDDACTDHRCSGTPRACDDDIACNGHSTCDEASGQCTAAENQCPAGQHCIVTSDTCSTTCDGCVIDGICVPEGTERPGNPCLVCQPGTSDTAYTSAPGKLCGEPATECSGADTCDVAAVCQPNHLLADTPCGSDARSSCAAHDACDGQGACTARLQPDNTPCPDASFCTSAETCQGGVCQPGAVTSCPGGQTCDPTLDACRCSDVECNIGGTCVAAGTSDPNNVCFWCDPTVSADAYTPHNGAACGDTTDTVCDRHDVCNEFGACSPNFASTDTVCSAGNECSAPSNCDGNGGCPTPESIDLCDDGIFCNGIERCVGGVCEPGRPRPGCIEP